MQTPSESRTSPRRFRTALVSLGAVVAMVAPLLPTGVARADGFETIHGSGSTWAHDALDQWRTDVAEKHGMTVFYSGGGATQARRDFIDDRVDFAVSETPFDALPENGGQPEVPPRGYQYVPFVAGGLTFAYNLFIGGVRVTDLRLSGPVLTRIFTGAIQSWNDPAIQAENPGHRMPDTPITPVVRADSNGTSAQFTQWMSAQYPDLWHHGAHAQFPVPPNGKAQRGSDAVAGYVGQFYGQGGITYVEHAYALAQGLPVVRVRNAAGYFVAPSADAVSVALLGAQVRDGVQVLDGVYRNPDPRAYPVSAYAYLITPTEVGGIFSEGEGRTLGLFASYAICEGQQHAEDLGYAPLPINLVREAAQRVADIPGAAGVDLTDCHNPTFEPGDTESDNRLLRTAVMPSDDESPETDPPATTSTSGLSVDVVTSGRFELESSGTAVDFGTLRRGRQSPIRQLGAFTVIDDRDVLAGWTVQIAVADFTSAESGDVIPRSAVGHATRTESLPPDIAPGRSQAAGSAIYPAVVAAGGLGSSTGEAGALFDLDLAVQVPRNSRAGTYTSTLTLTLLSD